MALYHVTFPIKGTSTFAVRAKTEEEALALEEVDELKAHVWTNQTKRDLEGMRKEAIQVAAMAIRFAHDVCNEIVGRK